MDGDLELSASLYVVEFVSCIRICIWFSTCTYTMLTADSISKQIYPGKTSYIPWDDSTVIVASLYT